MIHRPNQRTNSIMTTTPSSIPSGKDSHGTVVEFGSGNFEDDDVIVLILCHSHGEELMRRLCLERGGAPMKCVVDDIKVGSGLTFVKLIKLFTP